MKVLLDSCVWGSARIELEKLGHDAVWAGDWERDPGDDEILSRAHAEGRVLVTLDKDYGELAVVHRIAHSGIVRLVGFSATQQAVACNAILRQHGAELSQGAIVTVEQGRVRIRMPPSDSPDE